MVKEGNSYQRDIKVLQYNLQIDINPAKTALVVVDMQNDVLHSQGILAKQGFLLDGVEAFVGRVSSLMNMCRAKGIPVIATRHIIRENHQGKAVGGGIWVEMRPHLQAAGYRQGTWGAQIIEGLPIPDFVVEKHRFNAFYGTGLESLLRSLQAEVIIFSGAATNICVESTIRDAFERDFRIIAIEDCLAAFTREAHEASLITLRFLGAVISSKELSKHLTK